MLFVLTGDIQTGKTRWLANVIDELNRDGVGCAGVLAPGIWRECGSDDAADDGVAKKGRAASVDPADGSVLSAVPRFEKLGIENVLLPQGEHLLFALRRDLASQDEEGRFAVDGDATRALQEAVRERLAAGIKAAGDAKVAGGAAGTGEALSQSAAAKLGWAIADDAIDKVNAHFDELSREAARTGVLSSSPLTDGVCESGSGSLLVVDELGQLELLRGRGLVSAVALLQAGPSVRFPHALVIVREWLLDRAEELFFGAWPERMVIMAGDDARRALRQAFGLKE